MQIILKCLLISPSSWQRVVSLKMTRKWQQSYSELTTPDGGQKVWLVTSCPALTAVVVAATLLVLTRGTMCQQTAILPGKLKALRQNTFLSLILIHTCTFFPTMFFKVNFNKNRSFMKHNNLWGDLLFRLLQIDKKVKWLNLRTIANVARCVQIDIYFVSIDIY